MSTYSKKTIKLNIENNRLKGLFFIAANSAAEMEGIMREEILEREMGRPSDWTSNVIYRRNADGMVTLVDVQDDNEGVDDDAGNDQTSI